MPDIVFLLLFFFMVSATIQTNDTKVKVKPPSAEALTKVQRKFLVKELRVGFEEGKTIPKMTHAGQFVKVENLPQWVAERKAELDELYRDQMVVLLRVDENVEMGYVTDIQQELRRSNARKVLYRTLED